MGRTVLGIDVGSAEVKVVEARQKGQVETLSFFSIPTPAGAVENGSVVDSRTLAEKFRQMRQMRQMRHRRAVAAVSSQQVATRVARLPHMSSRELAGVLELEADKYFPAQGDAIRDYAMLGTGREEELELLLVSASRAAVVGLARALQDGKLKVRCIELENLATYRAILALGLAKPGPQDLVTILDLGEASTRLSIFGGGAPAVSRSVSPGGRDLTTAIAEGMGVPWEQAEASKQRWGVRPGTPVAEWVTPLMENLFREVWRSLEFYMSQNRGQRLTGIYPVGGNALLPGLADGLGDYLSARMGERLGWEPLYNPVQVVTPGAAVRDRTGGRVTGELDARFAAALGLALWKG